MWVLLSMPRVRGVRGFCCCGGDAGMWAVGRWALLVICVCGFVRLGMGWDGMGRSRMLAGIVDGTVYG